MKPETLAVIVAAVIGVAEGLNVFLFLRIRVAQLEGEKRVLDEVEKKYVRKDVLFGEQPARALSR